MPYAMGPAETVGIIMVMTLAMKIVGKCMRSMKYLFIRANNSVGGGTG